MEIVESSLLIETFSYFHLNMCEILQFITVLVFRSHPLVWQLPRKRLKLSSAHAWSSVNSQH